MIERIKNMYPNYLIFIRKKGKLYDVTGKEVINMDLLKKYSHVIVEDESYEVHTKIGNNYRHKSI